MVSEALARRSTTLHKKPDSDSEKSKEREKLERQVKDIEDSFKA